MQKFTVVIYHEPNRWETFEAPKKEIDVIREWLSERGLCFVFTETSSA